MEYFPLGLAEGSAFCNRFKEREKLKTNVDLNRCSIITSPRRYGKSSLILYVLEGMKIPYERIDLFVTLDESTIAREIIDGVNNLINKIISKPQLLMASLQDILKNIKTKWSIGTDGVRVELSLKNRNDDTLAIRDALAILDNLLTKKKQKAVFFIDEFQEIGVLAKSKGIEGAIRSIAEKSKYLVFIFSGSNRHILSMMFDDRSRPLYMLCDKIILERIEATDYIKFINNISEKRWKGSLSAAFYKEPFNVTEFHPYYVNLICGRLYLENSSLPSKKSVTEIWDRYLKEEKSKIGIELSKLSLIQKKIMILIAHGQSTALTSKDALTTMTTTSASVVKAIQSLIAKDYIYEVESFKYKIVDPLIGSSIKKFFPDNELI